MGLAFGLDGPTGQRWQRRWSPKRDGGDIWQGVAYGVLSSTVVSAARHSWS
jgi:hypothetical protein